MRPRPIFLAAALSFAVMAPALATISVPSTSGLALDASGVVLGGDHDVIRVKDDKGNGGKKDKGHKKHKKAEKKAEKKAKNVAKAAHKGDKRHKNTRRSAEERTILSERVLAIPAPQRRDMRTLATAVPLALLGREVIFNDIEDDRLLTYRNCPPGLAKKDPPCVPPGLAKDGVTYDEWVSYDDDRLERIYDDRRDGYLRAKDIELSDTDFIDDSGLLLSSDQIAQLYGLRAAPRGQRYALIDGMPVVLEDRNYSALSRINDMARVPALGDGVLIAPTAALTQAELMQTYRLPPLDPGYNYSVLNGEVIVLEDEAFDTLQLIRIARAVL